MTKAVNVKNMIDSVNSKQTVSKTPKSRRASAETWVAGFKSTWGKECQTCKNKEAVKALRDILKAMVKLQKPDISLRKIFAHVKETVPSYTIKGYQAMHAHMVRCEAELWSKAKGK